MDFRARDGTDEELDKMLQAATPQLENQVVYQYINYMKEIFLNVVPIAQQYYQYLSAAI